MQKYPRIIIHVPNEITEETVMIKEEDIIPYASYGHLVEMRANGELNGEGIYLPDIYEWQIVRDSDNQVVLLATRRPTHGAEWSIVSAGGDWADRLAQ